MTVDPPMDPKGEKAGLRPRRIDLPDDIILEIFRLLPTNSKIISTLPYVCKRWTSWFPKRRLLLVSNYRTEDGYLFSSIDSEGKVVKEFRVSEFRRVCYSNDLPFLLMTVKGILHLCDPSSGDLVALPKHHPNPRDNDRVKICTVAGYVPATRKFKLVSIFSNGCKSDDKESSQCSCRPHRCEVLEVGTDCWREVRPPPFNVCSTCHVNGVIYFLEGSCWNVRETRLVAFVLERDEWRELPLPPRQYPETRGECQYCPLPPTQYLDPHLTVMRGALCLLESRLIIIGVGHVRLWMLKDEEKMEWLNVYDIEADVRIPSDYVTLAVAHITPLGIWDDGKIVMKFLAVDGLFLYDPIDKSLRSMSHGENGQYAYYYIDTYVR